MSLGKLLIGSSPSRPTYVLATVQSDFVARDGSSELSVGVGDDVYLMFSIEGWAFATDLRDGSRRGYVPLSFCKAVEDFYVPPPSDPPKSGTPARRGSSSAAAPPQPSGRRGHVTSAAAASDELIERTATQCLRQPTVSASVKTRRSVLPLAFERSTSVGSTASFDAVSCSSLEVSEIEADAAAPCPFIGSPTSSSCSGGRPSRERAAATAAIQIQSGGLESLFGYLAVSEHSAFERPTTTGSAAASAGCARDCGASPLSPADDGCYQLLSGCRYQKISSRLAAPRFASSDASHTDASAASYRWPPQPPACPVTSDAAYCKDGGRRQSTSDEGYNSLVKYADTEAWRDRYDDESEVVDDALSLYSVDFDSL